MLLPAIDICHSSWNFAENFCELREILRGKFRGLRGELCGICGGLRGKFCENSPKCCVILKKFRTNFKALDSQNPKNLPFSANYI